MAAATCWSRIAVFPHLDYFGNNHNRFYMEMRCDRPCIEGSDFCADCQNKDPYYRYPCVRRFDHGRIDEPIPERSHIYDGPWYHAHLSKWGCPNSDSVEKAMEYQREARKGVHKVEAPVSLKTPRMPPRKRAVPVVTFPPMEPVYATLPSQGVFESKEEETVAARPSESVMTEPVVEKKPRAPRKKRPVLMEPVAVVEVPVVEAIEEPIVVEAPVVEAIEAPVVPEKKPRAPRKPAAKKAKPSKEPIVSPLPVEPASVAPEWMETEKEEIDPAEYEVVRIRVREWRDGYWLEPEKKKVYLRTGVYVGRYDPATDQIVEDVPDSDNEEEEA